MAKKDAGVPDASNPLREGFIALDCQGRSPDLWVDMTAPPSHSHEQWYFEAVPISQWRDRAGFTPASLLTDRASLIKSAHSQHLAIQLIQLQNVLCVDYNENNKG